MARPIASPPRANPIFSNQAHRPNRNAHRLSIAPMMDRTDPHWRRYARLLTREAMLYTEMIPAQAFLKNAKVRTQQRPFAVEHPITVQLGGADEGALAEAAGVSEALGYEEVNLNCGCPSERVAANGKNEEHLFGAALMRTPDRVARICSAMRKATRLPVSVKCRLGVDNEDSYEFIRSFVARVAGDGGVEHFIVHARKALLKGLSPAENRSVPPLRYEFVHRLTRDFPALRFTINGGFKTPQAMQEQLSAHGLYGVMVGRHAFESPAFLASIDNLFFGAPAALISHSTLLAHYAEYCTTVYGTGPGVAVLFRPVVPLFDGVPGAKRYKQALQTAMERANKARNRSVNFAEIFRTASCAIHPTIVAAPVGSLLTNAVAEREPQPDIQTAQANA